MIILLMIVAILLGAAGIYVYKCTHYWQGDYHAAIEAGFVEQQATLPDGSVINYAQGPDNGDALLLIHGQTGAWKDYCRVLPELSKNWHVFVVDCYGHGESSHGANKYYRKENGEDLIWFVDQVIGGATVVSGHSSGGLLAAYVAAYGGEHIVGAVLEDPPVFSTEEEHFSKSWAYLDTYKVMNDYTRGEQTVCWEAYYLRNCLWGQLFMASSMNGIANYTQRYYEKNPDKPVQIFFMPEQTNFMFLYSQQYDFEFGAHFYDCTWSRGVRHETLMGDIHVPVIYLHVGGQYTEGGIFMGAATDEQAEKAEWLMEHCVKIELTGQHDIHRFAPKAFIDGVNRLL